MQTLSLALIKQFFMKGAWIGGPHIWWMHNIGVLLVTVQSLMLSSKGRLHEPQGIVEFWFFFDDGTAGEFWTGCE